MTWQETVLTGEEMSEEIQKKTKKWSICNPAFIEDIAGIIANEQAEVAWKAGYNEGYKDALQEVGFTQSLKEGL